MKELTEEERKLQEEQKLARISQEIKRLNSIFSKINAKTKKAVHSLIENAAFMSVTLEDLQVEININGTVEKYQNGKNQFGYKKSSAVEVYNHMIKNHMGIMKQLADLLPKGAPKQESDGFDEFVNNR